MIQTKCDYCGRSYELRPFDYNKSKNHFCSSNCYHLSTIKKIDSNKQSELGYVIGYVCGDGWISNYKRHHLISIATIEDDAVRTIANLYSKILPNNSVYVGKRHLKNKEIGGRKINSKEIFNIVVNSKELYALIDKQGGKYSMPNVLSEKGVKGFIAGLFDAEGSVCYNGKNTTLQIASKYIENLLPIQKQLKHFGIKSKVKKYNCGILYICGKDIKTFYEQIPIKNTRKKKKLKELVNKTSFYNRYTSRQKKQVIELFKSEKSFKVISRKLGVPRSVLSGWIDKAYPNRKKRKQVGYVTVECAFCGKEITRLYSDLNRSKHNFCSKKCYGKWKKKYMPKGENHHLYSSVEVKCESCGKKFKKQHCRIKRSKHNFCSRKCYMKWRWGGG